MSDITPDALRAVADAITVGDLIDHNLRAAADTIEALTAERDAWKQHSDEWKSHFLGPSGEGEHMSEKPDQRVEIMCQAIWMGDYDYHQEQAIADGFAALESAGWRIVRLQQVDPKWNSFPCYRIIEEGPA